MLELDSDMLLSFSLSRRQPLIEPSKKPPYEKSTMGYEVDYTNAEKKACSAKLTIENRIFYVKLFESSSGLARYYAGAQDGAIIKEISKKEFNFWLEVLAEESDIKDIKRKVSSGKKYSR